jgi:hypothetical protein
VEKRSALTAEQTQDLSCRVQSLGEEIEQLRRLARAYSVFIDQMIVSGRVHFIPLEPEKHLNFVKGPTLFGETIEKAILSVLDRPRLSDRA